MWHVATFVHQHMGKGKNCVGLWEGEAQAPALLACRVKLVLICYVKLNFYLTLNYVWLFKKVYIH